MRQKLVRREAMIDAGVVCCITPGALQVASGKAHKYRRLAYTSPFTLYAIKDLVDPEDGLVIKFHFSILPETRMVERLHT